MHRMLIITVAILAAIFGAASTASACSCMAPGPPCQAFWKADAVFDATVEGIDLTTRQETLGETQTHVITRREHVVHLKVLQGWKGVQRGSFDVVTASDGAACGYDFKPGRRYLVFAYKRPLDGRWSVSLCSATREYDGTGDAAAFLASLSAPPTGGRIFGTVKATERTFTPTDSMNERVVDTRVRLFGGGQERAVTSTGGRYEITGLGAGPYRLELELPKEYSTYAPSRFIDLPNDRACAQEDFGLAPSGRIVGRLVSGDGRPVPHVAIEVTVPEARAHPTHGLPVVSAYTEQDGNVEIRGLAPGRYIVGVNLRDLPSEYRPYARTLYPSDGTEPTIVMLDVGQTYDLGTWKLPPPLEGVKVQGSVLWPDGTPAAGIYVHAWDRTGQTPQAGRGVTGATSDAEGQFTIELRRSRVYTFTARDKRQALPADAPRLEVGNGPVAPIRIVVRRTPPG